MKPDIKALSVLTTITAAWSNSTATKQPTLLAFAPIIATAFATPVSDISVRDGCLLRDRTICPIKIGKMQISLPGQRVFLRARARRRVSTARKSVIRKGRIDVLDGRGATVGDCAALINGQLHGIEENKKRKSKRAFTDGKLPHP